jgi:transcriptional regulator with XRE-family HTH domain
MNTKKSGNKAVGAYLRKLREIRGYTRTKVAAALDTNENQIKRIEDAVGSTSGLTLLKLIRLLDGSAEQVADLVMKEDATEDEGRRLAEEWGQKEITV